MTEEEIIKLGKLDKGYLHNRIKFPLSFKEKAFYEHWKKENKKVRGLNYGQGILQDLLIEGDLLGPIPPRMITKINSRDRFIVATVIQWLGSNVGWCFLQETLKDCGYKIVKLDK